MKCGLKVVQGGQRPSRVVLMKVVTCQLNSRSILPLTYQILKIFLFPQPSVASFVGCLTFPCPCHYSVRFSIFGEFTHISRRSLRRYLSEKGQSEHRITYCISPISLVHWLAKHPSRSRARLTKLKTVSDEHLSLELSPKTVQHTNF